jgi:hypothetical protein
MRGAYMVFDMDNDEIWIGGSVDCGSNIVPIGKSKDAVPMVPGCEAEVAPEPTTTGYGPPPTPTVYGKWGCLPWQGRLENKYLGVQARMKLN